MRLSRLVHSAAPGFGLLVLATLLVSPVASAQLTPPIPGKTGTAGAPLVITLRNVQNQLVTGGYYVCVGTSLDHQQYGMFFTNRLGQVSFADAPTRGTILVSVAPINNDGSGIRYGAELEVDAGASRALDVKLATNWSARCPGVARRTIAGMNARPTIVGSLRYIGSSIVPSRRLRFYTTSSGSDEPYVEVSGQPNEYRTFQGPEGWSAWRTLTVTDGNHARFMTHDIRGNNGPKEIRVQMQNTSTAGLSPEYTVNVTFVEIYSCELEYQRANTAFAPLGVPEGNLGKEVVTVMMGDTKTFDTGWPSPNENRRGYGMHLRIAKNTGQHAVDVTIRTAGVSNTQRIGRDSTFRYLADLVQVRCP